MRLLTGLICFWVASCVMAGNFTIATVDMQKLFKEYPGTAQAQKQFKAFTDQKEQDLEESKQILSDFQKELQDAKGVLSSQDLKLKEKKFADEAQNYQDEKNDVQQELLDRETQMTQTLLNQIKAIVAQVAQKDGVDLVLDSNEIVDVTDGPDLTNEVLKKFSTLNLNSSDSDDGN